MWVGVAHALAWDLRREYGAHMINVYDSAIMVLWVMVCDGFDYLYYGSSWFRY